MCVPAWGDAPETGSIEVAVEDAAGGALPGVTVGLESDRGSRVAVTDEQGRYRFALLLPGDYEVEASLEGFGRQSQAVRVESGVRKVVDLRLALATEETVQVVAEAALVDKYQVGAASAVNQINVTGIDAPTDILLVGLLVGDRFAATNDELGEELLSAGWGWSITNTMFLEARAFVDPESGQPFTAINRYGRGPQDQSARCASSQTSGYSRETGRKHIAQSSMPGSAHRRRRDHRGPRPGRGGRGADRSSRRRDDGR